MFIIGTAGHVDHGKTSLIRSLTGIDTDRLPEEKKRELTIELGFAHIDFPNFDPVGIIDVPGHERFIRNMVRGAWGVDIALLIIAADDGWMPQTEDHFKVLQLLGVQEMIIVLNKIDLVNDKDILEWHHEMIKERLLNTHYKDSPVFNVSAITMEGLESLKQGLFKQLKKLKKIKGEKPYLFVDRSFLKKGEGVVITGTLKNGQLNAESKVQILPENKNANIKKLQIYGKDVSAANTNERVAINLSGVSQEDIDRGSVILKKNFFTTTNTIIAHLNIISEQEELKNNTLIEMIVGTKTLSCKAILLDDKKNIKKETVFAKITLESDWFFYYGEKFIVTHPGSYAILGGGTIVACLHKPFPNKLLKSYLNVLEELTLPNIIYYNLLINDILPFIPDDKKGTGIPSPISDQSIIQIINQLINEQKAILLGNDLISVKKRDKLTDKILKAIDKGTGLSIDQIVSSVKDNRAVIENILKQQEEKGKIKSQNQFWFTASDIEAAIEQSKEYKDIINHAKKSGKQGLEINKMNPVDSKKAKELIKRGELVSLDGNIFYYKTVYEDLKTQLLQHLEHNEKLELSDAKNITGLSRKYILPLLNKMESDRLIRRMGDYRVKY